jgi:hypothetical protein
MATIITRLYSDEATANTVVADLKADPYHGHSSTIITGSDALDDRMKEAGVGEDAAAVYKPLVEKGNALLVVKALLGQAQSAIGIVNSHPSIEVDLETQNAYVSTTYEKDMSKLVDREHKLQLTEHEQISSRTGKRYGAFLVPLLSKRTPPDNAVYRGTKRFGDFLVPLLSKRTPPDNAVYRGTKRFGAFLVPLLSSRTPKPPTVYHGTKRFGAFLLPLILRRDGSYARD